MPPGTRSVRTKYSASGSPSASPYSTTRSPSLTGGETRAASASPAKSASAVSGSPAGIITGRTSPPPPLSPIRSGRVTACTGPGIRAPGRPMERFASWAAWMIRSSCAASVSNPARSKRPWNNCPGSARRRLSFARIPGPVNVPSAVAIAQPFPSNRKPWQKPWPGPCRHTWFRPCCARLNPGRSPPAEKSTENAWRSTAKRRSGLRRDQRVPRLHRETGKSGLPPSGSPSSDWTGSAGTTTSSR